MYFRLFLVFLFGDWWNVLLVFVQRGLQQAERVDETTRKAQLLTNGSL